MTKKEYLSQVYYLDKIIDAKIEQSQRLKGLATRVSPVLKVDKVDGGSSFNQMDDYISKWVDLENEINNDINRLVDLKVEIESVINKVVEQKYRLLLTLRYLNSKKWEEIADIMGFTDVRWVYSLHKKALDFIVIHVPDVI